MVGLLALAHERCCEAALAAQLADLLQAGNRCLVGPLSRLLSGKAGLSANMALGHGPALDADAGELRLGAGVAR